MSALPGIRELFGSLSRVSGWGACIIVRAYYHYIIILAYRFGPNRVRLLRPDEGTPPFLPKVVISYS